MPNVLNLSFERAGKQAKLVQCADITRLGAGVWFARVLSLVRQTTAVQK